MRGLHLRNFLLSTTSLLLAGPAFANGPILPTGGQYVAGSGVIGQTGATMTVTQTSGRGVINWQGFSIGQGGTVQVNNGAGATLNRVTGGQLSSILGTLKATGSLYLINPQGVVIGSSGVVVTGGDFVVSTHDVLDQHFMAGGSLLFKSDSPGVVTNLGQVSSTGGDVILIAREVTNAGTIQAPQGTVGLAGASEALLTEGGRDGQRVFVRAGTGRIENQGLIEAAQAELKAAGGNIYALAGNNGGVVRATGSETRDGRIWLTARSGDVANSGTLAARNADGAGGRVDVRAPGGMVLHSGAIDVRGAGPGKAGGTVVMTGDRIGLLDGSTVDASGPGDGGKVRIGGDWQGGKDPGKTLSSAPLPAARRVTMTAGATIKADGGVGGGVGNGGSVVLWSSELTKFAGSISAAAGPAGGDGGAVETSSVGTLQVTGAVSTRAPAGKTGQWLLDPNDITIASSGPGTLDGTGLFDAGGGAGTISAATIVAGLDTTNVLIQAANDIIVNAAITYGGPNGAAKLTLKAGDAVTINAAIGRTGGHHLDLVLDAGSANTSSQGAAGILTVDGLKLLNGKFDLNNAGNAIGALAAVGATQVKVTTGSSITVGTVDGASGIAASGAVTLKAATDITVNAGIATTSDITLTSNGGDAGGTISVYGASILSNGGGITLSGGSNPASGYALGDQSREGILLQGATLNAGGGDIVLRGKGVNGVSLSNGSQVLTTTGSITVTGVGMGVTALAQQGNPDAASAGIALSYADLGGGNIRNALIQTTTGAISLTGSNDTSVSTNRAFGISFWGGDVKSTGGAITLTGSGGGTVASLGNDGISLNAPDGVTNAILSQGANAGAITLTGNGRGGNAAGVRVWNHTTIQSAKGAITLTGQVTPLQVARGQYNQFDPSTDSVLGAADPGAPIANVVGVDINFDSIIRNTGGSISISGDATFRPDTPVAADAWTGNGNRGVMVDRTALIDATGTITVTGKGGGLGTNNRAGVGLPLSGTGFKNDGVDFEGGHVTATGNIVVTGTAGDGSNSHGQDGQQGIVVEGQAIIETTAPGASITMTGLRGTGSTATSFYHGVQLNGSGVVRTADGDITITGHGSGQFSSGVILRNLSSITAGGSGAITIVGTTFAGTATEDGSWIDEANGYYASPNDTIAVRLSGGVITAHNGNISITGLNTTDDINSPHSVGANLGINIRNAATTVQTDGTGSITLNGTGGGGRNAFGGFGVHLDGGSVRATGTGAITVNGAAGPTGDHAAAVAAYADPYLDWGGISNAGVYVGSTHLTTASGAVSITGTNPSTATIDLTDPLFADEFGTFAVYSNAIADVRSGGALSIVGGGANGRVMLTTPATGGPTGITALNQAITVQAATDVDIKGDINAGSGGITVRAGTAGSGNLTLSGAAKLTVSGASDIVLAAVNGNFVNTATAGDAALALGTGRWLVYSTDPRANTGEMATYGWRRYNATYAGLPPASVPDAGNGFLYSVAPTVAVTVAGTADKVYDGATTATGRNLTVTGTAGAIHGDTLVAALTAGSATGAFADRDAGAGKTVTYAASLAALTATDTNGKPVYGYGARVTDRASIAAAPLSVTATAASKTYGQVDPTLGYTASGVQAGDTVASVVSGALGRQRGEDVGDYAIGRGTLAANSNYILTFTAGQLAITPAPLVIQADDALRISGIDNPTLGASYSGLVNGDGASVVSGLTVTTAASATSPAGHYAIAPSGASARNYVIRYVNGVMTVTAAPTTFEPPPALGGTATGGTSSATGFQNRSGGVQTASAPASFVAPRSEAPVGGASGASPSTTVSTSSFTPSVGGGSIITVRAPGGGSEGGSGAPGASTGGQLEASVNAGSFNVIYSQPADYRVSTEPRGGGGSSGSGPGAGGSLASSTSFTTFSNEDHPSVSIVNSGEPASRGGSEGGGPTSGDTNGRQ